MTGFNLPPGCNVSDLPGNSREDDAAEALYNKICDELVAAQVLDADKLDDERSEKLINFILVKINEARNDAWLSAVREQQEYEELKKTGELAEIWQEQR